MNAFVSDDHQPTRDRVSRLLEAEGFTVRRFPTADSAAAALSVPGCAVDLVVTDVQMPGEMDGVDLAAMLTATRPNLPVVVMSSDPHELERTTTLGLDVPTLDKLFLARRPGEHRVSLRADRIPGPDRHVWSQRGRRDCTLAWRRSATSDQAQQNQAKRAGSFVNQAKKRGRSQANWPSIDLLGGRPRGIETTTSGGPATVAVPQVVCWLAR